MTDSASCSALSACALRPPRPLASSSLSAATSAISAARLGLVLGRLGLADLLGRRVAPRLRLLQPRDDAAPRLVERDQLAREPDIAAGASPRFFSPASNASGLSLIHLMSNMGPRASAIAPLLRGGLELLRVL